MYWFDRLASVLSLASIFLIAPVFGQAFAEWRFSKRSRSAVANRFVGAFGTLIAIALLMLVYGTIWKVRPRLIAWYDWIDRSLPITGDVEVSGAVDVSGSSVTISR